MRIGQLTFHASHNYGSVLQAYALNRVLKEMGHSVEIINLRNEAQRHAYRCFKIKGKGWKKALHFLYALYSYPARHRRFKNFEQFINHVLPLTEKTYTSGKELPDNMGYDCYITGSDQVWNPVCQDFEPAYYLDFVKGAARTVSYAPSLGRATFDTSHLELIRELLEGVDWISCREEAGARILRQLTSKPVHVVCDPVVLLGRVAWMDFSVQPKWKRPYILTYFLENNNGDKRHLREIQAKMGYEVVSLNEDIRDLGKRYHAAFDATPQEFVGLFQNASFVLTNSFHATAFSTLFHKPFYAICGDSSNERNPNDSRKTDYLKRLGLEERILACSQKLPSTSEWLNVDYQHAQERLESFRAESRQYLLNALSS